jgi:hypothetical protein
MAILTNRYWILLAFFTAAVVSYSVGSLVGVWLFVVAGVIFELAFWFELIRWFPKQRREASSTDISSWQCRNCRETNPGEFEFCWNCKDGRA